MQISQRGVLRSSTVITTTWMLTGRLFTFFKTYNYKYIVCHSAPHKHSSLVHISPLKGAVCRINLLCLSCSLCVVSKCSRYPLILLADAMSLPHKGSRPVCPVLMHIVTLLWLSSGSKH